MSKKVKKNVLDDSSVRDCVGCSACSLVCHSSAISMSLTKRGFYEPTIDPDLCTMCSVCPDVCYKFNAFENINPFSKATVVAVTNNYIDDISTITTMGVATRLAEHFYELGYNVCGVKYNYDTNECNHENASSLEDILEFKGSKYIPSNTENAFQKLVESDKPAIVFGLPCQIYGLRKVIERKKLSEQFILVDLFCAGVPSQTLWNKYLSFLNRKYSISKLQKVNFRDKTQGWQKASMRIEDIHGNVYKQNLYNDMFYAFMLKKVCLEEACYNCEFRKNHVASDIKLGDFWGNKYKHWDDGVELLSIMTEKGQYAWDCIKDFFAYEECLVEELYESQKGGSMKTSVSKPLNYDEIMNALASDDKLEDIFKEFKLNKVPFGGV